MLFEITIPVLDEEKTLEKNVLRIKNYFADNISNDLRIVIADNGSTDRTEEIGEKLKNKYEKIDYLRLNKKGVGLALRTSWLRSKADIVGYMDLDLATDLKYLKEAYSLMKDEKIVIINGSRLLDNSEVKNRTLLREIISRGFNFLQKIFLDVKLSDGMCGFKFFRRNIAIKLINTGIKTDGWFFSSEILVKAIWSGLKIYELPVIWTDDRSSKVNILKLSIKYLKAMLRIKKEKSEFINKFKGKIK